MQNITQRATNARLAAYHRGDLRRLLVQAALEFAAKRQDWTFSLRKKRAQGFVRNALRISTLAVGMHLYRLMKPTTYRVCFLLLLGLTGKLTQRNSSRATH